MSGRDSSSQELLNKMSFFEITIHGKCIQILLQNQDRFLECMLDALLLHCNQALSLYAKVAALDSLTEQEGQESQEMFVSGCQAKFTS